VIIGFSFLLTDSLPSLPAVISPQPFRAATMAEEFMPKCFYQKLKEAVLREPMGVYSVLFIVR
jgi:hypothetical protein